MPVKPISNIQLPLSNIEPKNLSRVFSRSQRNITDNNKSSAEEERVDFKVPLEEAVDRLNRIEEFHYRGIQFSIDKETDKIVIRIVDSSTNEVIKQIPPEEVLSIAKRIDEFQGLLLNKRR